MTKHLMKVELVVRDALIARGFSAGESMQMITRLSVGNPDKKPPGPAPTQSSTGQIKMPFGKYRGWEIRDIKSNYLIWLSNEDWFTVKFTDLGKELDKELIYRRKAGTI